MRIYINLSNNRMLQSPYRNRNALIPAPKTMSSPSKPPPLPNSMLSKRRAPVAEESIIMKAVAAVGRHEPGWLLPHALSRVEIIRDKMVELDEELYGNYPDPSLGK